MDDLLLNKILGAILGSFLLILVLSYIVGPALYHPHHLEEAAYHVDIPEAGGTTEEAAPVSFASLIAAADPAAGERQMAKCKSCHTWDKGGANGTGPNLYDVVNRARAGKADFGKYSSAMKAKGGTWDLESIFHFIDSPKTYVEGTAMTFAGFGKKVENAANVVAFLNTMTDNPRALPAVEAPAEEAPAEEAPAATTPETPAAPEHP